MICTMLDCVRPVSLDIWRVERSVCVWPSWLSRPTSSSTVVTFYSVRECFGLPLSCLWSVHRVSPIVFSKVSSFSLLQFIFEYSVTDGIFEDKGPSLSSVNRIFLNWHKFVVSALSTLLNGMLHYQYIVTALTRI